VTSDSSTAIVRGRQDPSAVDQLHGYWPDVPCLILVRQL
jgi:hypothetical protein